MVLRGEFTRKLCALRKLYHFGAYSYRRPPDVFNSFVNVLHCDAASVSYTQKTALVNIGTLSCCFKALTRTL